MTTLSKSGATELVAAQASAEFAVNETIRRLNAGFTCAFVEDRDLTAPPVTCADEACYLVAASPTGAWSGKAGQLAVAVGANASNGWYFQVVAIEGFRLRIRDEDIWIEYDGAAWGTLVVAGSVNVQAVASATTVTPTFLNDLVDITAQAAALNLANPTGTAVNGWGVTIRIKDNGTARAITYGTQYRAVNVTLPTTTVVGKVLYLGGIWNSGATKLDILSVSQEA